MIGKQLKTTKYKALQNYLSQNAHSEPLCPTYEIGIVLNGESYTLSLLLDKCCKVYALYALRSAQEQDTGPACPILITENALLSAIMELVIYQCAA